MLVLTALCLINCTRTPPIKCPILNTLFLPSDFGGHLGVEAEHGRHARPLRPRPPEEADDLLEGLPELVVEDGVDERVEGGVDVAEPRGEEEEGHARVDVGVGRLEADGGDDVAGEEGDPAEEEAAWKRKVFCLNRRINCNSDLCKNIRLCEIGKEYT